MRRVLAHQLRYRPVRRKLTGIPYHYFIGIYAYLDGYGAAVVLVHHGIEHGFPQSRIRHRPGFDAAQPFVADQRLQVFRLHHLDRPVHLRKKIAVHFVMVAQIGVGFKKTDLHIRTGDEFFRIGMKKQGCSPLEVCSIEQMQLVEQRSIRFVEDFRVQTLALQSLFPKIPKRSSIEIAYRQIGNGNPVPVPTEFPQKKPVERGTFQFLASTAAPKMIFTLVADRAGIRLDHDFNGLLPILFPQVHLYHNPQHIAHLVRNIQKQLPGILYPDHLTLVVPSDYQHAALGIREAANPLQVVIPPRLLPLDVLVFFHHL